jgi:hypothetical protein
MLYIRRVALMEYSNRSVTRLYFQPTSGVHALVEIQTCCAGLKHIAVGMFGFNKITVCVLYH